MNKIERIYREIAALQAEIDRLSKEADRYQNRIEQVEQEDDVSKGVRLRFLRSHLHKVFCERKELRQSRHKLVDEISVEQKKLPPELRDKKPHVTDHAVKRYCERKLGLSTKHLKDDNDSIVVLMIAEEYMIDLEYIRAQLLTPMVLQAMRCGLTGVRLSCGGTVKLANFRVVTYLK